MFSQFFTVSKGMAAEQPLSHLSRGGLVTLDMLKDVKVAAAVPPCLLESRRMNSLRARADLEWRGILVSLFFLGVGQLNSPCILPLQQPRSPCSSLR